MNRRRRYFVELSHRARPDFAESIFAVAQGLGANVYVVRRRMTVCDLLTNRKNLVLFRNRMHVYSFQPESCADGSAFLCRIRSWHMNKLHVFLATQPVFDQLLGGLGDKPDIVSGEVALGADVPLMIDFFDGDAQISVDDSLASVIEKHVRNAELETQGDKRPSESPGNR